MREGYIAFSYCRNNSSQERILNIDMYYRWSGTVHVDRHRIQEAPPKIDQPISTVNKEHVCPSVNDL